METGVGGGIFGQHSDLPGFIFGDEPLVRLRLSDFEVGKEYRQQAHWCRVPKFWKADCALSGQCPTLLSVMPAGFSDSMLEQASGKCEIQRSNTCCRKSMEQATSGWLSYRCGARVNSVGVIEVVMGMNVRFVEHSARGAGDTGSVDNDFSG